MGSDNTDTVRKLLMAARRNIDQALALVSPPAALDGGVPFRGTVKWYSAEKGYGFIVGEDGKDLFVHHSAIKIEGHNLKEGQKITYSVVSGPRGPQAFDISVIE